MMSPLSAVLVIFSALSVISFLILLLPQPQSSLCSSCRESGIVYGTWGSEEVKIGRRGERRRTSCEAVLQNPR